MERSSRRGRLRVILRDILGTGASPERTAASLAAGIAIGLSPFVGLHTLIVVVIAFATGLNRLAAFSASCIFNPWSAVPIVLIQIRLGALVRGRDAHLLPDLPPIRDLSGFLAALSPRIVDYYAGGLLLSSLAGIASYPLFYAVVRYLHAHHIHLLHSHRTDGR